GEIGSAVLTAKLETDFANFPSGVAESRETPRIRLAYVNVERGNTTWRFGQDWDVVAPLLPAANNETLMWNNGNLGDRRPMAQVIWQRKNAGGSEVTLRAALGLTGAVNNQDLDPAAGGVVSSLERDGFDSGLPHLQVRGGMSAASWVAEKRWEAGIWGYVAQLETDSQFAGEDTFTPWCIGADWTVPLHARLTLRGELWTGAALGDVRGTIGQTVNTTLGEEIGGWGGWMELVIQVEPAFRVHVGGTLDDPEAEDLSAGSRELNTSGYVGGVYDWGKGFRAGLDAIYWETQTQGQGVGNMVRFNAWVQLDF
ncbi:MAG: hypothetical protein ACREID_06580, partial [Planctomycetota bacterium]